MASERAKAIEHDLHGGHIMPGNGPVKNTGGCRCPRCVERRCELIDKMLLEERMEAEKKTAKRCIEIASAYRDTDAMLDEIAEKFGVDGYGL